MSKTSAINKSHIHQLYVSRNTVVSRASNLDGVSPVRKVENNAFYSDGNYLYYSDAFYDHLNRFEKAYSSFYTQSNRLSKLSKKLMGKNFDKGFHPDNLIKLLDLLTKEYNKTMTSLKTTEEESNIRLSSEIMEFLLKQQQFLGYLGITLKSDYTSHFSPWIFRNNYHYNSENMVFLMTHKSYLLQELTNLFKTVTIEPENSSGYQSMDRDREHGVLLDQRT